LIVPVLAMVSSVGGWASSLAAWAGRRLRENNKSHNVDLCIAHLQLKYLSKRVS
jgi:hypothetical protein